MNVLQTDVINKLESESILKIEEYYWS